MTDAGHLRIGELSRRSGVSPELLRAWERRYGVLRPSRSPGGLRLYSEADLERLRLIQKLTTQLGLNLNAIVCQRLAKKRDGKGRVPVNEIMVATPLVRKYIIEGEFEKLKGTVGNREAGSQSFDQHLTELFMKQIIDVGEAKRLATNVDALNLALRGISNSDSRLK
mgnify:CR=1 FL=1